MLNPQQFKKSITQFFLISLLFCNNYLLAAPAVFFNADLGAGRTNFSNTISIADSADASATYNTFTLNLSSAAASTTAGGVKYYQATSNGTTIYVVTSRSTNNISTYNSFGYNTWSVNTGNSWTTAVNTGYKLEFYSNSSLTTRQAINSVGLEVWDWGTCCTGSNVTPSGTSTGSSIYMVLTDGTNTSTNLVGGITTSTGRGTFAGSLANGTSNSNSHFVAAIDDSRNTFNTVTMVPNGSGEQFGAGGILYFSLVGVNTVPAGSSDVTVGVTDIIGAVKNSSDLGITVNPRFDGGTLKVSTAGTLSSTFTITSANGTIDQNGVASTFSGVVSNDVSGTAGGITIINTGTANAGAVTFSNTNNTYSGSTSINAGAKLSLSGSASIADSSGVSTAGTFDISGTTSGATIKSLSGTGSVVTASGKSLTLSNASGTFSGAISGNGGIRVSAGTQTLTGTNVHSGTTQVDAGATLTINSGAALGSGTLALVGTTTTSATLATTASTTISNPITVKYDPTFNIASGTTTTVSSVIADGGAAGDVVVTGGGTLLLTNVNTYTGLTTINAGSALALSGLGSIANSMPVSNSGSYDIRSKTTDVSLGGSYTQGSSGSLLMNFSTSNNQKLIIGSSASLDGTLSLNASSGTYAPGRYAVLTAGSRSGTFASFSSNLSSYTSLLSSLDYDATNVYLVLALALSGPSSSDTQSSLTGLASRLRSSYNHSSLIANNTYDCNLFDVKGMCISAGGRYSTVDNPSSNSSAAVVTLGYKVSPSIRIGGFLDQSVTNNNPTGINLSNKNPMMGVFAYWNQNPDGLGYQVKLANAYQDKDLSTTRDVIGTSEAGRGTTSLTTQSYVGELSYAFMFKENTLVRPYFALRHTSIEQDAYTETGVDTPLTYSALNDRTTSALMGVKFKHALTPKANLTGSLGLEQDLHHKTDQLRATGVSGLTSESFSGDLHRTRPVASIGATYDIAKTQRLSGEVMFQQLPFQNSIGGTVYANYMIGF